MAEYDISYYGYDEARFHKLKGIITGGANIADLNAHLLISPSAGPFQFTADDVKIGDTMYINRTRISIIGGGEANSLDQEISENFVGRTYGQGFQNKLTTTILCYLWDDDFVSITDPFLNGQAKELFMSRIVDFFVHNIFNTKALGIIELDSHVMRPLPNYDPFYNAGIRRVSKEPTVKGIDNLFEVMTVTMVHEMEIR